MQKITVSSKKREEIIDITPLLTDYLKKQEFTSGLLLAYSPHTTAAITVNENADPDVQKDFNSFLKKLVPQDHAFAHIEGNSDAHIKGSLTGFSQSFIVENGRLQIGTWQGVYFVEFDGPRNRQVWLKFIEG